MGKLKESFFKSRMEVMFSNMKLKFLSLASFIRRFPSITHGIDFENLPGKSSTKSGSEQK